MANLLRLIVALALLMVAAAFAPPVHASFAAPTLWSVAQCGAPTITGPSLVSIATQCATRLTTNIRASGATDCTITAVVNSDTDRFKTTSSGSSCSGGGTYFVDTPVLSCPANSTLTGSICTCQSGYAQVGSTCVLQQQVDNASCKALADGLNYVKAPLVHFGSVGLTACFGGFVLGGTGAASGGGQTELYGPFSCSGANASACSVVPKPSTIVVDCPAGQYPGTVNGLQVCSPPENSVEAPKTTTAIPPSPGASAPQIPDAPAGSTVQEEQTVCTGTKCTTTITYKNGSGAVTGSKTEEQSKPNYCAENPKAPGCEEKKSAFSGDSTGGFTFDGDAIQGAIAEEVYTQNCLMNKATDESALYLAEKAKTGDQTGTLPGNDTVNVGPGNFDSSDAIGGAACITDKTVTVWGKSIVLPFSTVCPAMGYLKAILLAVSYLTAAGIVIGRKT